MGTLILVLSLFGYGYIATFGTADERLIVTVSCYGIAGLAVLMWLIEKVFFLFDKLTERLK